MFSLLSCAISVNRNAGDLFRSSDAAPRVHHIVGGHRRAAGKLGLLVELEGDRRAVGAFLDIPALGQQRLDRRVAGVERHQRLIDAADHLDAAELIGHGRIHRDLVGQVGGEDQRFLGTGGCLGTTGGRRGLRRGLGMRLSDAAVTRRARPTRRLPSKPRKTPRRPGTKLRVPARHRLPELRARAGVEGCARRAECPAWPAGA